MMGGNSPEQLAVMLLGVPEVERMVRIILHGGRNKGAIASLLVAVVAAASVWAGYWVWHHEERLTAVQRTLTDITVQWRCPNGHVFWLPGAYEPVACPTCGQPAQVLVPYECPKHGTVDLVVMFDKRTRQVSKVQWQSGQWISAAPFIRCPFCDQEIHPKRRTPFDSPGTAAEKKPPVASADTPS